MNKTEVANFLRVSTKSIERYVKAGKLKVIYIQGKAVFDQDEVEALKEESEAPVHRALPVQTPTDSDMSSLSLSNIVSSEERMMLMHLMQELIEEQKNKRLYQKMLLTLEESIKISGLSRKGLLEAIKKGHLMAIKDGRRWKLRYIDIINLIENYFNACGNVEPKELLSREREPVGHMSNDMPKSAAEQHHLKI